MPFYDQACRLLRMDAVGMPGLRPDQVDFVEWLDTRQIRRPGRPDRTCDTVAHLRDDLAGGVPWAVAVELPIDPDPEMLGRGMGYLADLWLSRRPGENRGDRYGVGLIVVNLRGRGPCARDMTLTGTKLFTRLGPVEVNLSTTDAGATLGRVLAGEAPAALLPWIPLFQGGCEAGMIQEWKRVVDAKADPQLRHELQMTEYFAEAAGCVAAWRPTLEGLKVQDSESEVLARWSANAHARGWKEGRKEGEVRSILRLLGKCGPVPSDLAAAVKALSEDRLDAALDAAAVATSHDEFRRLAAL